MNFQEPLLNSLAQSGLDPTSHNQPDHDDHPANLADNIPLQQRISRPKNPYRGNFPFSSLVIASTGMNPSISTYFFVILLTLLTGNIVFFTVPRYGLVYTIVKIGTPVATILFFMFFLLLPPLRRQLFREIRRRLRIFRR